MAQLHNLDITASSSVPIDLSDGSSFFLETLAKLTLHDSKPNSRMTVGNIPQTFSITSRLIRLSISQNSNTSPISSMAVRRTIFHSLDQLQGLWRLVLLYVNSMPQPQQCLGPLVLEFLQTLQAVAPRIVSLRPKMSFVQKYCLQWTVCIEDCLKVLATGHEFLRQSLLDSITESMLVSALEIPEIVVAINEQLGPLLQIEATDKPMERSATSAHQVRSRLTLILL